MDGLDQLPTPHDRQERQAGCETPQQSPERLRPPAIDETDPSRNISRGVERTFDMKFDSPITIAGIKAGGQGRCKDKALHAGATCGTEKNFRTDDIRVERFRRGRIVPSMSKMDDSVDRLDPGGARDRFTQSPANRPYRRGGGVGRAKQSDLVPFP